MDETDGGQFDPNTKEKVATGNEDKQTVEYKENMDPYKRPNIELKVIEEVYPESDLSSPVKGCQNEAE